MEGEHAQIVDWVDQDLTAVKVDDLLGRCPADGGRVGVGISAIHCSRGTDW
ncbi:hypothetical protein [Candidatus Mycobacterium methanotrophicum]|uniref:Uncharacterized protein n=1 Tax=Candidatus Mycobacterium methanotrophicum TaxID=2943498 RepID=A0ABY4QT44_9MYCO|nr:hypothetical protein [Candidatus Mycobacterium methanotrophicum]UQX12820.1 hypothetical protein M5I08_12165 [Candidatus Mycobacterium methanotrophicum]